MFKFFKKTKNEKWSVERHMAILNALDLAAILAQMHGARITELEKKVESLENNIQEILKLEGEK